MTRLLLALVLLAALPLVLLIVLCEWAGVDPFVERARKWEGR